MRPSFYYTKDTTMKEFSKLEDQARARLPRDTLIGWACWIRLKRTPKVWKKLSFKSKEELDQKVAHWNVQDSAVEVMGNWPLWELGS